jgi:hypothetical protein
LSLPRNTSHHLCNEHKVDDERRSQQRILANVEESKILAKQQ